MSDIRQALEERARHLNHGVISQRPGCRPRRQPDRPSGPAPSVVETGFRGRLILADAWADPLADLTSAVQGLDGGLVWRWYSGGYDAKVGWDRRCWGRVLEERDGETVAPRYAIELDSVAFHLNRAAFEDDRCRWLAGPALHLEAVRSAVSVGGPGDPQRHGHPISLTTTRNFERLTSPG